MLHLVKFFLYACPLFFASLSHADALNYQEIADTSGLQVLTPSLTKRQSIKLRLQNGLEAYLISDPGIEQSAASLAVEVGSWSDPEKYPGMGHLLEHMLFMGTKAYPDENGFMRYVSDNGGLTNAYTASDRTVYMFSVNNEALFEALDRFAHFFIDPLFNSSSIERELHAVDQEHAKNIEQDGWREYMVFKETGNPRHPNIKFSTGNAQTLKGIPSEAMKEWYQKHYSANRMHLIVLSALPIDQLVKITTAHFNKIQGESPSIALTKEPMISSQQLGKIIYIQPIKELKNLNLMWELPRICAIDQETKTDQLIAYALKSGAGNTLKTSLKKAQLIEDLNVSLSAFSKEHKLFTIELKLTDLGLQELDLVIQSCFAAIDELKKKGLPPHIFVETSTMARLKYQYQSREKAFDFVKEQASYLIDEDLSTYPLKTLMPTQYNPQRIKEFLNYLTPKNSLITVVAPTEKVHVQPNRIEKWMAVHYSIVPPSEKQLNIWHQPVLAGASAPPLNPYIPVELAQKTPTYPEPLLEKVVPEHLINDDSASLYFAKDGYYLVPEIAHTFRIHSPLIDGSARSKALTDLYLKALQDKLLPSISMAESAGLYANILCENFHLLIDINGFSAKAPDLAKEIFSQLNHVRPTQEEFSIYRTSLSDAYENSTKELPFIQAGEVMNSLVFNCAPTSNEKMSALSEISYEDFMHFANELFEKSFTECLLYGDLTKSEALILWANLKQELKSSPYPRSQQLARKVMVLPNKTGPYMIVQKTQMQGNAALLLIEEGLSTFDQRSAQQVFAKALSEDFFATLRTKQQTGYIARSWATEEEGQLLHYFVVQSSTHQPNELIARFELFLENFLKTFNEKLPFERFDNIRKMLITSLQMRPENMFMMAKQLELLAFTYDGDFERIEKRVQSLQALNYSLLAQTAENFFSRSNTKRLAVLTEGVLPQEKTFCYKIVSEKTLRDQATYLAWK